MSTEVKFSNIGPSVKNEPPKLAFMQKYAFPLRVPSESDLQSSGLIAPNDDEYINYKFLKEYNLKFVDGMIDGFYDWRVKPLKLKLLILILIIIILIGVIIYLGYEMFNQHKDIKNIKQNNEQLIKLYNLKTN